MKTKQLLFGAIALIMALPMSAVQTTWYVRSATGSDASGDGTLAKPWATFGTAYGKATVLSGDILDVSGTFTVDYGKYLTKSITIQGNDKTTAIFDGTAGNASLKNFANMTTNSINITIENVTFQNYNNYDATKAITGGVLSIQSTAAGSNVTIRNCNFLSNTGNLGAAISFGSAGSFTIEDCYFYNNYAKATTSGTISNGAGSAIYISTGITASASSINRCLFENNTAQGSNGSAIAYSASAVSGTASASMTITNSTFTGNSLTYSTATTPLVGDGVVNVNATGTGVSATLTNNTIAYNTSARTSSGGTPGLYIKGVANLTTLKNNILFSNFDTQGTPVSTSIGSSVNLYESRNNITDVPSATFNWTTKTTNGATMASGNVSSIVNGSSVGQLGLSANAAALADNGGATKTLAITNVNSAAINAGYTTGAPAVDSRNVARVGTIDVGAYEGSIIAGAATATAFTTTYGTASAEQTFPITGRNLIANLIATAPIGFEVSSDGSSYGATAAFTNNGGSASGTLSVRLAANAGTSGSYNAQNIVLSSTNCNAVNIVTAASGNIVTAKVLTVTGAATANKVYDGTTTASVTGGSLVGVVSPDEVVLTQAGDFDTKNVGTSKTITANCSISGGGAGNYSLTQPTLTARDITAVALSITAPTIASKTYDGSATSGTVTAGALSGFVGSETVIVTAAVGTYPDATVGTSKSASIVYTLANGDNGGLATNYSLANGSATGDITSATTAVDVTSGTPTLASLNLTETSEVTVSGTGVVTFDADKTVRSVTADTGGNIVVSNPLIVSEGVTVAPNATLNLSNTLSIGGDLTLKADQTSTFSVKVGSPMTITGNVKFLKTMDDTQWYFMAFPCNVALSGIKVNGSPLDLGTNFFIKYYSGSNRASNGTGANWIPVVLADDHLIANQGYIFGLPDEVGLGQNVSVITFPLDRDVVKSEAASRTLAVNYYGTLSNVATNLGWNLIGQPFLSKYASQDGDVLNLYRFNGSTYDFYAKNTFNLPEVNPFEAYFTQVNSSLQSSGLTFGLNERRLVHASVAVNQSDLVRLNFSTATGSDKTYLIMDDLQSTSYQIGEDLEKMITTGTTIPQVYSVLGGINYANNALPVYNVQSLPIGFYTQTAGSTTIGVDATKATSLSKLLLTDNGTSPATVTDLLTSNYTFTAASGINNTRFLITAQRITTDNNVIASELGDICISMVNGKLSINNLAGNSTIRVYDALGRMIINKNTTSNVMDIKLGARGIYTVQLQSGTTISSRKVIF